MLLGTLTHKLAVKKGYKADIYTGAVTISYNKNNTDYEVTTVAADYTVTPAAELPVEPEASFSEY